MISKLRIGSRGQGRKKNKSGMKKFSWFAILAVLVALLAFFYVNKPSKSVADRAPEIEVELAQIFDELEKNYEEALDKYGQKVILIKGNYYSISGDKQAILILKDEKGRMANCQLENPYSGVISKGESISLKGVFVGYEDLLGEIQLNKCYIE
jgi:tRNA_anti-like